MTLEERLKTIEPNELVFIGGKYSSGFFIIREGKDALDKVIAMNDYMKGKLRKNIASHNGRINAIESDKDEILEKLDGLELEIADMESDLSEMKLGSDEAMILANKLSIKQDDFKYWSERLQNMGATIQSISRQLKNAENNLKGFVDLEKHEVVEEYMKLYDKPLGRVLLIDGYIYGTSWYWFLGDKGGKGKEIDDSE